MDAVPLTSDLCGLVPASVLERWSLTPVDPSTASGDADLTTSMCSMSGVNAGDPVTLDVELSSYGGADSAAADAAAARALASSCDELDARPDGTFEPDGDSGCRWSSPTDTAARGTVIEARRVVTVHGVVRVEMAYDGQYYELVPAEVIAVSGSVTASDDLAG